MCEDNKKVDHITTDTKDVKTGPKDVKTDAIGVKTDVKGLINKAAANISKSSAYKQLLIGSASGWTTGFLTMQVGKQVVSLVGVGIILFQVAQHKGYVSTDWDKVKEKVEQQSKKFEVKYGQRTPQWKSNVTKFARSNTLFAAGFVGGFLIGLAI